MLDKKIVIGVEVDAQLDFAKKGGNLYVPAKKQVLQNIAKISKKLKLIIGSADSHSYDSPEFLKNAGIFPAHCVKGTEGWSRIPETRKNKKGEEFPTRFIPMAENNLVIGENEFGKGNRQYGVKEFSAEVQKGVRGIFEKEIYSAFANPLAEKFIKQLVNDIGGNVLFAVYGYCGGNYCVDAFAKGLKDLGFDTAIITDAIASINVSQKGEKQNGLEVTKNLANKQGIRTLTTKKLLAI